MLEECVMIKGEDAAGIADSMINIAAIVESMMDLFILC
jgi:hypothetical protein